MSLEVVRMTIDQILAKLRTGEWQVPKFQREFIWSPEQVFGLLNSIFKSRPLGLITLWAQPQANRHTSSEPITLRNAKFKHFDTDPAVMKLILDGRQRLTAMTMAFGGLREADARRNYSGAWFLNIDADPNGEQFIVYKIPKQIESEHLNTKPVCLAKALIPLEDYKNFSIYSGNVNNSDFYPKGTLPDSDLREKRRSCLASFHERFLQFQIPIAELPDTVSLAEVCEIFDVLNTTGTKVSTFDLIHNLNFAKTSGKFDLRGAFEGCQDEYTYLSMLCDSGRQEFFCQLVTACYLSEPEPKARKAVEGGKDKALGGSDDIIRSIKGGDLLETPTFFYEVLSKNLPKIDTYCAMLFSPDVLGTRVLLKELPYPVSVLHYLSLRWAHEKGVPKELFSVSRLNRLFRAFFWSNALSGRYDQGFLSLFATDLKNLRNLLLSTADLDDESWAMKCNASLDEEFFTTQNKRRSKEELTALISEGELRGAAKQAISLFMYGRITLDLVKGSTLDRFAEDQEEKVQLHHIYPKDWCKNNRAHHTVLQNNDAIPNAPMNLVPLKAVSNNLWKTKSPSTAILEFGLSYEENRSQIEGAFINEIAFSILSQTTPDPEAFWKIRAALMAEELVKLQAV